MDMAVATVVVIVSQKFEAWLLVEPLADQSTEHVYSTTISIFASLSPSVCACVRFVYGKEVYVLYALYVCNVCVHILYFG